MRWCHPKSLENKSQAYVAQYEMYLTATRSSTRNGDNLPVDLHTLTPQELEKRFNTSLDHGLDASSAYTRLLSNGPNCITRTKPSSIRKALSFLVGGFTKQLWICFVLAILSYRPLGSLNGATPDPTNIGLAGVVLFLIVVEVSINLYHERTTQAAFQAFETIISTRNLVLRSGTKQWVKNEELVVGDVVDLRHGGMVPADMRIFAADCLRLDTSVLDGAPKPKTCTLDSTSEIYIESHNVALFGSFVVGGCGRGVVVAVGDQTVMGKLSQVKKTPRTSSRQLSHELDRFKYIISLMAIAFGGLVLVLWSVWLNPRYPGFMSPATAVTNATSIIVAFVPEGVSFGLTLTLAVLAKKMLARKMLIKDLSTVESIGSLSVLAADKTGTLTLKELQVSQVILDQVYTKVPHAMAAFQQLATILSLCNSAKKVDEGDATDVACLKFTESCLPREILHTKYRLEDTIPFRSERRWMAAIYTPIDANNPFQAADQILMIKGAPETLLPCCISRVSSDGIPYPVEKDFQAQVQADVEFHSRQGKRVLVIAYINSTTPRRSPTPWSCPSPTSAWQH
ncbi:hypothetical protein DSO57_1003872 [Entomophthora muscae]|uniref:Uncharacterized protein n=1 Tax=Entomophthora muscae TaxID=34485 RepID=A0ACC2RNA9_9FUNG|nr:hypothetical protein DSO57_1003872 [Entomophthora muscae]